MMSTDVRNPSFTIKIPDGDDRERSVCTQCGFIDYKNPKILVGTVVSDETGRILLCRRAIEPSYGRWTLPAGFMENGETPKEGAAREAWEEARAELDIGPLLAVYSVRAIDQVQLIFRGRALNAENVSEGPESLEVRFFAHADIPWADLAFPTVQKALRAFEAAKDVADEALVPVLD